MKKKETGENSMAIYFSNKFETLGMLPSNFTHAELYFTFFFFFALEKKKETDINVKKVIDSSVERPTGKLTREDIFVTYQILAF